MTNSNYKYLTLLSSLYPSIQAASNEIINLNAILNLPKSTEHFLSDIHGEYDSFLHMISSGSGVIKDKIDETFKDYSKEYKELLATIIYYPEEKLDYIKHHEDLTDSFCVQVLSDLIDIARISASKYTRSKVRKCISPDFVYIIEELLQSHSFTLNKEMYYKEIIDSIILTKRANEFIIEISKLIQKLSVDHLHILGDIYDRGNGAYRVMDLISKYPSVDIAFGNHDIAYMGASVGNLACVANVIRTCCRYNHLSTLEEGYGISLRPLVTFAMHTYQDDPCLGFIPNQAEANNVFSYEMDVIGKMHKAIAIIEFKLESALVKKHPNYNAMYLDKMSKLDLNKGVYKANGIEYKLTDLSFPTVDKANPCLLSKEEEELIHRLALSFKHCTRLSNHVDFLFSNGAMYFKYNDNLLFHGCIPTNPDGSFLEYRDEDNNSYSGVSYLDYCDKVIRRARYSTNDSVNQNDIDFYWFLWCCSYSPLYGKSDILTFEKLFLSKEDFKCFKEEKNSYYKLFNNEDYCNKILDEFNVSRNGIIINGHMPVKMTSGESPIKANGKLLVIDGGISRAYQSVTGLAGYTLIYNSYGIKLIAHEIFVSKDDAIANNKDIVHDVTIIRKANSQILVKSTDKGLEIMKKIFDLSSLLEAYQNGTIKPLE